jgi:hypothetical protein
MKNATINDEKGDDKRWGESDEKAMRERRKKR